MPATRSAALEADAADLLRGERHRFAIPDDQLAYLDGNSLGRPPLAALERIREVAEQEWAAGLVGSWSEWIDLPARAGDRLAPLLGAARGEVLLSDQTSLNLYKLASAAVGARPGRTAIVTDDANFPSDRYVLQGIAQAGGLELRVATSDPAQGTSMDALTAVLDDDVALVSISHAAYKSAALVDLGDVTEAAHAAGALVLFDLSHSAGVVPIDLDRADADLAVGCTYKYLNGGPGAPAFLYVRADLQSRLTQPIHGWFGHDDMFAFAPDYRPSPGLTRFAVGTPPIVALAAAEAGIAVVADVGIAPIRAKSTALTDLIVGRFDAWLAPLGFTLGSPREAARRGGHVAVRHPDAARINRALAARDVVADFRHPDSIRLAPAPLYTGFTEVWDALAALRDVVAGGEHLAVSANPSRVP